MCTRDILPVVQMWDVSGCVSPQLMGVITPRSYAHFHTNPSAGVLSVLSVWQWLSVAVKKQWERHGDAGWLLGGFVVSWGNFPRRQLNSIVCQPQLAPLAAIVPTAVNHTAYKSEPQSIGLLMKPNSSQSLSVGIHWHIWRFQLVTWIPSGRISWSQAEINRNKYFKGKRWLCLKYPLKENSR